MMKTLVIYDSMYGNTEKVARAMAAAIETIGTANVAMVGDASAAQLEGVELLLVGSPTRGFRPTPATSAYLKKLPAGSLKGVRVAAFDTRMNVAEVKSKVLTVMARIFGYAAAPIAKGLVQKGGSLVAPPEGFFVTASEGPLKEGELDRAKGWARRMAGG
jgi:flavodoxin